MPTSVVVAPRTAELQSTCWEMPGSRMKCAERNLGSFDICSRHVKNESTSLYELIDTTRRVGFVTLTRRWPQFQMW